MVLKANLIVMIMVVNVDFSILDWKIYLGKFGKKFEIFSLR